MIIINIEGIDKVGKETQTELLVKNLKRYGIDTKWHGFPNYDNSTATILEDILNGRTEVTPEAEFLLFAANIVNDKELVAEERSAVLILDRYMASTFAYGHAKGVNIDKFTCVFNGMPKPDITILLKGDMNAKGEDVNERDHALMQRVEAAYRYKVPFTGKVIIIDPGTVEDVQKNILDQLDLCDSFPFKMNELKY